MEGFGAYTFIGKSRPSQRNQIVVIHLKRPQANNWRKFKPGAHAWRACGRPAHRHERLDGAESLEQIKVHS